MPMQIFFSEHFKQQLKKMKKKYPHVKEDLLKVMDHFSIENEISIARSIYKIRVGCSDMKKGKSGGFRSYIYAYWKKNLLVPLCIYAKSDIVIISDNELKYHFDKMIEEIMMMI